MARQLIKTVSFLACLWLAACTGVPAGGPPVADQREIAELSRSIRALGPEIDPSEADRAAQIAYGYSRKLAISYQITDPPLIHNRKVNRGEKPRGLCWHWAEDMEARLKQERFQTLDIHRAIANSDSWLLIDHSTAIVSRRGDTMRKGLVLDPWRYGGRLFWSPVTDDRRYKWLPREQVLEQRRQKILIERGWATAG